MCKCMKRFCRACFPDGCCGFCKTRPQQQEQVDNVIHLEKNIVATETPYGFIRFFPGGRKTDNKYTCPMISLHLWRAGQHKSNIAQSNRTVTVDARNRQTTQHGPQSMRKEEENSGEEEVIMIPLEDVTHIHFKSEYTKAMQADIQSEVIPKYELSENCCDRCCATILGCCCCRGQNKIASSVTNTTILTNPDPNRHTNYIEEELPLPEDKRGCCSRLLGRFRCWCCRKNQLVRLTKKTNTDAEAQAKRVITMTLEYSKYSNLDTPTHTRLLSDQHRLAYYKERFEPHTQQQFYLVSNTEFDSSNFKLIREQAEHLCRIVLLLKGMRDHYPSEDELNKILDQSHMRIYGTESVEPALQLESTILMPRITGSSAKPLLAPQAAALQPPTSSE